MSVRGSDFFETLLWCTFYVDLLKEEQALVHSAESTLFYVSFFSIEPQRFDDKVINVEWCWYHSSVFRCYFVVDVDRVLTACAALSSFVPPRNQWDAGDDSIWITSLQYWKDVESCLTLSDICFYWKGALWITSLPACEYFPQSKWISFSSIPFPFPV